VLKSNLIALISTQSNQFEAFSKLLAEVGFCEFEYAGMGLKEFFPKPRAGCSNHPGGTTLFKDLRNPARRSNFRLCSKLYSFEEIFISNKDKKSI